MINSEIQRMLDDARESGRRIQAMLEKTESEKRQDGSELVAKLEAPRTGVGGLSSGLLKNADVSTDPAEGDRLAKCARDLGIGVGDGFAKKRTVGCSLDGLFKATERVFSINPMLSDRNAYEFAKRYNSERSAVPLSKLLN